MHMALPKSHLFSRFESPKFWRHSDRIKPKKIFIEQTPTGNKYLVNSILYRHTSCLGYNPILERELFSFIPFKYFVLHNIRNWYADIHILDGKKNVHIQNMKADVKLLLPILE